MSGIDGGKSPRSLIYLKVLRQPRDHPANAVSLVADRIDREDQESMEASHVSALQLKHDGLERQIRDEMDRPLPDLTVIQKLKKQKLRLKEELTRG